MENKLTKKYGLITAICMVVGIVIGSGIFFKAQNILEATKGNVWFSVLAWAIGGIVMVICASQFAVMATKYSKVNGVVDYAEETCGSRYAYYVGWFATTIYYPAMTSVLAWVSARYFGELIGWNLAGPQVLALAGFFLIGSYVLNTFSPKIAGYFQVSTTVIKLIPLLLMAIVGVIAGFATGTLTDNFAGNVDIILDKVDPKSAGGPELFAGVCATAFAYEGWIIATSINSEIKNAKRNLPLALLLGSIIVVAIYILYNIGVAGGADVGTLIGKGATTAFTNIFGAVGGAILSLFVVISCLGTLNGLMVGCTRGMYSIATRNEGPKPEMFKQIDASTNMPTNSSIFGLLVCAIWLLYFYGANLNTANWTPIYDPITDKLIKYEIMNNGTPWFGLFSFDSSELPIITIYGMYIPMLVMWIIKEKDLGVFKRFVLPILAIVSCLFLVFVAVYAHGITPFLKAQAEGKFSFPVLFYLIIYAVIMGVGFLFSKDFKKIIKKKKNKVETLKTEE
ncbi:MAG: APC family permease [Clostridia bacterium]|nr:APC family permease [Clostridia bacterium]